MSFLSDKETDLRRGAKPTNNGTRKSQTPMAGSRGFFNQKSVAAPSPATSPTAYSTPNDTTIFAPPLNETDVVTRARVEREARRLDRELQARARKIQSWWRGRHGSSVWTLGQKQIIDGKLNDIEKLTAVMKQLKGAAAVFVPPLEVSTDILRRFVFIKYANSEEDVTRLVRFCDFILAPSIIQPNEATNIATFLGCDERKFLLIKFVTNVMNSMALSTQNKNKLSKAKSRNSTTPPLSTTFLSSVDKSLVSIMGKLIGLDNPVASTPALGKYFLTMKKILENQIQLTRRIRIVLTSLSEHLTVVSLEESSSTFSSQVLHGVTRPTNPCFADSLVDIARHMVESVDTEVDFSTRLAEFAREIFATPLVTCVLSTRGLQSLTRWQHFPQLLTLLSSPQLALPPSSIEAFQSGQWLLGNVASLAPFLDITEEVDRKDTESKEMNCISNEVLGKYLTLTTTLLRRFDIPGILQGKSGVVWLREGTNLFASGVPTALRGQVLSLLHQDFTRRLYVRILLSYRNTTFSKKEEDVVDIRESLRVSGLRIAKMSVEEQQQSSSWFSSKWASKVTSSISSTVSRTFNFGFGFGGSTWNSSSSSSSSSGGGGSGITSGSSKKGSDSQISSREETDEYHSPNSFPICPYKPDTQLLHALGGLWSLTFLQATLSPTDSAPWKAMCSIAFSTRAVDRLWVSLVSTQFKVSGKSSGDIETYAQNFNASIDFKSEGWFAVIATLTTFLPTVLVATDDAEMYEISKPLPLHQIVRLVRVLKHLLYNIIQCDPHVLTEPSIPSGTAGKIDSATLKSNANVIVESSFRYAVVKAIAATLADLYNRWARRPYSSSKLWEIDNINVSLIKSQLWEHAPFATTLFHVMPWSIDFYERLKIFREAIDRERLSIQGSDDTSSFFQQQHPRSRGTVVRVRRSMILEDGMAAFERVGNDIKDRVVVRYINEFGEEEAGIDVGGLFKDFLTDLSRRIFDPNFGLFSITSTHALYPNPAAFLLYPDDEIEGLYLFLGRVLGKALFENITMQPQFAHFFLSFMHGKYNFMNLINDLSTLDKDLYKNLMFLKSYEGDIADLSLTFSISDDALGGQREVELFPRGSSVAVTSENR